MPCTSERREGARWGKARRKKALAVAVSQPSFLLFAVSTRNIGARGESKLFSWLEGDQASAVAEVTHQDLWGPINKDEPPSLALDLSPEPKLTFLPRGQQQVLQAVQAPILSERNMLTAKPVVYTAGTANSCRKEKTQIQGSFSFSSKYHKNQEAECSWSSTLGIYQLSLECIWMVSGTPCRYHFWTTKSIINAPGAFPSSCCKYPPWGMNTTG